MRGRLTLGIVLLSTALGVAQTREELPEGIPAMLQAGNGRKVRIFLQSLEDGQVTFVPYQSDKPFSVDAQKINAFEFFPKYEVDAVEAAFSAGDYEQVAQLLEPVMAEYQIYMPIPNNLQDDFARLMEAQLGLENLQKARTYAEQLIQSREAELVQRARVALALTALAQNDPGQARIHRAEVSSEAAGLYLDACIQRASGRPKEAIETVCTIIAEHANEVEWLSPAELLGARIYLDMGMTNSAAATARQVKNIYAGMHVAAQAAQLQAALEPIEEPSE